MSDNSFGTLMSALDPPLVVVTVAATGERAGCLVSFHTQSSMAPHRYCVFLSKANHTYGVALRASHLAIHFLTPADLPLAELFGGQTGDTVDKFAGLQVTDGPGGVPLLAQCPRWLAARRVAVLDEGGDHVTVLTEPVAAQASGPFTPLRVAEAGHIRPGHDARERHDPDT
jgi:flavin reductase (DIM6/NTAB) family NADH-FMN oxidoreductase RutF